MSEDLRATPDVGFKLRPLIRAVLTESKSTDVADLAHEVLGEIADDDRDGALFQALLTLVRESAVGHRASFLPPVRSKPSAKVTAIRDAWQRTLDQRLATETGQKFLRDCTIPDLEFAATARERLARQAADRAGDLRQLVEKMRQYDATTLGDLPAEALRDMTATLTRVAA